MRTARYVAFLSSSVVIASSFSTARAESTPAQVGESQAASFEERLKQLEEEVRELKREKAEKKEQAAQAAPGSATGPEAPNPDYGPEKLPFTYADYSWAPGQYNPPVKPLTWGPFVGEFRVDVAFHQSLANPKDDTISGSSEVFRSGEFQLTQLGIGGDFYYKGVHGRLMTQFGMYSQTTPRNDASPGRGQWQLDNAYRYISEAYGGYHINVNYGLNIQAGIFMSYVGLWAYYNFDNWTYQPSYVSSNTPWFFNGMRIQWYPTEKLKIELWIVNGWQAYGKFNQAPGFGLQILYRPNKWLSVLGNQYYGTDTLGIPNRMRIHTDDSIMVKVHEDLEPHAGLSQMAVSLTVDAGCEFGDQANNVQCGTQYFLGFMAYARAWFYGNVFALTFGGGAITNPGRYLVLLPPINGATAFSGTPYFSASPGDKFKAWDTQTTFDIMPNMYVTFRAEYNHRAASVPYFSGPGGVTPPGGNTGSPGSAVAGWSPDLVRTEDRFTFALLIKL